MYAIVKTGGKQYKVSEGDIIQVEKLEVSAGDSYVMDSVLLVSDGDAVTVGAPCVEGAKVTATVLGSGKAKKVIVYKYKSKKTYHRKKGHRQPYTSLKIETINA